MFQRTFILQIQVSFNFKNMKEMVKLNKTDIRKNKIEILYEDRKGAN